MVDISIFDVSTFAWLALRGIIPPDIVGDFVTYNDGSLSCDRHQKLLSSASMS
jgi:hypothetical protein